MLIRPFCSICGTSSSYIALGETDDDGLYYTTSSPLAPSHLILVKIHIGFSYVSSRYLERVINVSRPPTGHLFDGAARGLLRCALSSLICLAPKTLDRALLSHRLSLKVLDLDVAVADFDA